MKKIIVLVLAAFFIFPISCRGKKAPLPVQFETKSFEKSDKPCGPQKENCSYLNFQYVEFTQAPTPAAKDTLNQTVRDFLFQPIFEKKAENFEDLAKDFFAENQKLVKEFPEAPASWFVEKKALVLSNFPQVLALSLEQSEYLGGAHPNSHLKYENLNPVTGSAITLSDVFVPGYEDKLMSLAEKKFRERQKIAPNAKLNDAGFFFKDGKFTLPDNFSFGPKALTFYYNAYEIAPYVMGPLILPIDYQEIQTLLKPGGILPPKN